MDPLHTVMGCVIRRFSVSHIAILGGRLGESGAERERVPDQVRSIRARVNPRRPNGLVTRDLTMMQAVNRQKRGCVLFTGYEIYHDKWSSTLSIYAYKWCSSACTCPQVIPKTVAGIFNLAC